MEPITLFVESKDLGICIGNWKGFEQNVVEEFVFVQLKRTLSLSVDKYKMVNVVSTAVSEGCYNIEVSVPIWQGDLFLFETAVQATTLQVLAEAKRWHMKNLVIPTFEEFGKFHFKYLFISELFSSKCI